MTTSSHPFIYDLNSLIESENSQVLSALIIFPHNLSILELKRNVYLRNDINIADFKQFENDYIIDPEKPRTLTFSTYDEPVKYKTLNKQSDINTQFNPVYSLYDLGEIIIANPNKDIKIQEDNWNKWGDLVENKFPVAGSILWSYITLKSVQDSKQSFKDVICSVFIIFTKDIGSDKSIIVNRFCQDHLYAFVNSHYNKELNSQATRAAISQVMARNSSHNIGAHVMNKLIGDLNEINLFDSKKDTYYKSCTKKSITQLSEIIINDKKKRKNLNEEEEKNIIILDQISKFNNYVKCRMDYLADISFGTPLMQTNKYAYEDLFLKFDEVRLLLEHISGLSEFPFRIEFTRNGKPFKNNTREKVEDDLLVAIPNDMLGTQAFYNIIENVIRNTAKHGKKPDDDRECVFTVNFIDEIDNTDYKNAKNKKEIENILNEFIAVEIYDNYPVSGPGKDLTPAEKDEFKRTKTDVRDKFTDGIDELVFSQNMKLNLDILENSKLRPYSLGLVEMEASAAYLRKRPVEYINHSSYKIHYNDSWSRDTENNNGDQTIRGTNCRHFLKAFKKTGTKENFLGYRFFLHRPAVVLVVTKELPENIDLLKRQGILVVTQPQFKEHIKTDGKSYPHEFIVTSDDIVFDPIEDNDAVDGKKIKVPFLEYYKTSLPFRVISIKMEKLKELFDCDLNKWEEYCWTTWNECFLKLDYRQSPYLPMKNGQFSSFYSHEYPNNDSVNFYLDVLSSIGLNKLPEFNGDIGLYPSKILGKSDVIKFKVGESIYSRVLVIDERIQENSLKNFSERPISLLYNKSGILIPKYNLSANKIRFIEIYNDINKYLLCGINSNNNTEGVEKLNKIYDFILIHYSILERIFNSNKSKIETFLIKLGRLYNVVITSGRGEPDGLPKEVRFINLSSVIHALVESRSKYFANYILHQSRKSSKLKIK